MQRISLGTIQVVFIFMVGFPIFGLANEKDFGFCLKTLLTDSNKLIVQKSPEAVMLEVLTQLPDSLGLVPLLQSRAEILDTSDVRTDREMAADKFTDLLLGSHLGMRQMEVEAMVNLKVMEGEDGTHIQFLSSKKYFEKNRYFRDQLHLGINIVNDEAETTITGLNLTYLKLKEEGSIAQLELKLLGIRGNQVDDESFEIIIPPRQGGMDLSKNLVGTPFDHIRGLLRAGTPTTPTLLYIFALAHGLIPVADQVWGLNGAAHDLFAHIRGFLRMPQSLWDWAQAVSGNLLKQYFSSGSSSERAKVMEKMILVVDAFDGLSGRIRAESENSEFQRDPLSRLNEYWSGVWEDGMSALPMILTTQEFFEMPVSELRALAT